MGVGLSKKEKPLNEKKRSKVVLAALGIICLVILFWHLFFPFTVGAMVLTGGLLGTIVISVSLLGIACLLAFIVTGIGLFIVGIFAFVWVFAAIVLFPVLFPVLVPLLIVLICVSFFRRREK